MLSKVLASKSQPQPWKWPMVEWPSPMEWNGVIPKFTQVRQFCCLEWINHSPLSVYFEHLYDLVNTPLNQWQLQHCRVGAILFWNILLLVTKWICFISYSSWQEALNTQNCRAKPKYLAGWRKSRGLLEPGGSVSILTKNMASWYSCLWCDPTCSFCTDAQKQHLPVQSWGRRNEHWNGSLP